MSVMALITPNCTFMSFDSKNAYYSVSIFPPHRKYLRFMFEGDLYEFTCLPNGLSSGPRVFTKLMKVVMTYLRQSHDITISAFLDDNLVINYEDIMVGLEKGRITADAAYCEECSRSGSYQDSSSRICIGFCGHEGLFIR